MPVAEAGPKCGISGTAFQSPISWLRKLRLSVGLFALVSVIAMYCVGSAMPTPCNKLPALSMVIFIGTAEAVTVASPEPTTNDRRVFFIICFKCFAARLFVSNQALSAVTLGKRRAV